MALVIVAVTRAVFAAATFSATLPSASSVPVSASTLNMTTEGASSSSVNMNDAGITVAMGGPVDVPVILIVSSVSSTMSSSGVNTKVPVLVSVFAGIVISKFVTSAKSTADGVPEPATVTVTVRASSKRTVPPIVAVTSTVF